MEVTSEGFDYARAIDNAFAAWTLAQKEKSYFRISKDCPIGQCFTSMGRDYLVDGTFAVDLMAECDADCYRLLPPEAQEFAANFDGRRTTGPLVPFEFELSDNPLTREELDELE